MLRAMTRPRTLPEAQIRKLAAVGIFVLMGVLVLWVPGSTATGPTIVGSELIQTEEAVQNDACTSSLVCVEQCFLMSNGSTEPTGKFCCVDGSLVGSSAPCPMSSRVNTSF